MTTQAPRVPHVFIVAGEESGDRLGAALIRALRARDRDGLRLSGIGGRHMQAEGIVNAVPMSDHAIIGFVAIAAKFRELRRLIIDAARAIVDARPDVLVIIDSPDLTHRIARRVRATAPGIPIVDYVSPSVWAWRSGRARAMTRYVDHVLALLPFEPDAHRRLGGPPCDYVGHPLIERVADIRPGEDDVRRRAADPPTVLVMPGSRGGELRYMMPVFGETIRRLPALAGPVRVVVPAVRHLADRVAEGVRDWGGAVEVVVEPADKDRAFRQARAALVKSGTGTLELAVAGVPMVTAYCGAAIEAFMARRLIRVPSVILANLVLGENAVPEFLQGAAQPDTLARALAGIIADTPARRAQLAAFARLDDIMEIKTARPSDRAADIVMAYARRRLLAA